MFGLFFWIVHDRRSVRQSMVASLDAILIASSLIFYSTNLAKKERGEEEEGRWERKEREKSSPLRWRR